MKRKLTLLFFLLSMFLLSQEAFAQPCACTNCPVPIQDNGTFQGFLDVTVNGANDLGGCPLLSVCFTIQHTWVGDLSVTLTSPGGLNYLVMADANNNSGGCGTDADNAEVCITAGAGNALTNNTEYNCNGGACSIGTCCLNGFWTMPCGGVNDPISGAVQSPNCDLNDFNIPGMPANGTWTLTINDVCSQDVGSLIDWSLTFACGVQSCIVCEADGGALNAQDAAGCFGDPNLNLSLPPTWNGPQPNPGEYGYTYVISNNGVIMGTDMGPNMSTQPPGTYEVCGFSYALDQAAQVFTLIGTPLTVAQMQFSSGAAPFCGDFSDDCIEVIIGPPVQPTIIQDELCIGECITVGGQEVCNSTTLTLQSWLNCDSLVTVVIIPIPPQVTDLPQTVCEGECVLIDNVEYCPPGPYQVFLEGYQGCDSILNVTFTEIPAQAMIVPDPPPALSCATTSVILDGSLSVPNTNLQWEGPSGLLGTDPTITVTEPGDYTLTTFNFSTNPPCEDMITVTIFQDGLEPDLEVIDMPQICAGEAFDLSTLTIIDNNNSGAIITFHDGTPATPANELPTTIVMPAVTTTYYILGTAGDCTDETSVTVVVNIAPTPDFTVTSPICIEDFSTVNYIGTGSSNATYLWDFDGGLATPGDGPGPHTVEWESAGSYTITLTVEENGCSSQEAIEVVQVDDLLLEPVIFCGAITTNSVEFVWNDVPGATSYVVNVLSGQSGTQTGNTYTVIDLIPGELVEIEVIVLGNTACGESSAVFTCTAEDCPDIMISIDPVDDICLTVSTTPFDLVANVTGSNGNGIGTWSGNGITNAASGTFDPTQAGTGSPVITFDWVENGCDYSAMITINIIQPPTADFTVISPICVDGSTTVTYTGTASTNASYTWNFDGGTADPGTGVGPHTVNWASGGTKTVTLIVEESGCTSEQFSLTVEVDSPLPEPVINCNTTTTTITFIWNEITGASDYMVNVIAGATGTMTSNTSYEVTGLSPGDQVTIEVVAVGTGACGNSTTQITCEAQDCPMVNVTIDPITDICLDENATPIVLTASQMGGNGGGTFTWSGDGITDPVTGAFDPAGGVVGENNILVTYDENNCSYNGSLTINVFAQPTADFTVTPNICTDDVSIINYTGNASSGAIFTWNFDGGTPATVTGPGPHQIQWDAVGIYTVSLMVEENNCSSEMMTQEVQVDTPMAIPSLTCNATTTSVEFIWNQILGSTDFTVTVINGATGILTSDTSYHVTGMNPGDAVTLEVIANGGGACGSTSAQFTCIAQDCPPTDILIEPVDDICLDANAVSFDLVASVTDGTGTFTWSGDGITDPIAGTFNPTSAVIGANMITVTYEVDNCSYSENLIINLIAQPTADFSVNTPICIEEAATLMYEGDANINATYFWDFDGGIGVPSGGQGPINVTWTDAGVQTVVLSVTENGCESEPVSQEVQIDLPLDPPIIICNSTTNSIEFIWQNIANSDGYTITVLSGPMGTLSSDTSYLVSNLNPNDEVTIEVLVDGQTICGPVIAEMNCIAQDCPGVNIGIPTPPVVCLDTTAAPFILDVNIIGGSGMGTGTWSGDAIIDPIEGVFDPALGTVGMNEVTYTYVEDGCTFDAISTVELVQPPTADFTVISPICIDDVSTITFTGNVDASGTYLWNFGSGTALPGDASAGPHEVSWIAPGLQTISLRTEDIFGCESEMFTQEVLVEAPYPQPLVTCNSTTETIEFIWFNIPDVTSFSVNVLSGASGVFTSDTSYFIVGLSPNDEVTVEVSAEGNNVCGPTTVEVTCIAQDCIDLPIEITPVDPICLGGATVPIQLTATGISSGVPMWEGPGIIDSDMGIFDPSAAGVGVHQIIFNYQEDNCFYTATTDITIFDQLIADFTLTSPVCVENASTITYTGNAVNSANFTWDFNGGVATPGTGVGPHQVIWTDGGLQTVTLIVDENGCESEPFTAEVDVQTQLLTPVINCNTTLQTIEFVWEEVTDAIGYNVTVTNGPTGTMNTPTSYLVTGLNANDEVSIELEVLGNGVCPNPIATATCTALDCPEIIIDIPALGPRCLTGDPTVQFEAILTGGLGTGATTWSGAGIIDAANGIFNVNQAGLGTHIINYTYVENNCTYNASTMIEVLPPPIADAGADFTLTCEDKFSSTELGGDASSTGVGISYDWNANFGAFPADSTILHPEVSQPGTYTLTVTNTQLGCQATDIVVIDASQDIPVPELAITPVSCFGDTDGTISVTNVTGGVGPYVYALNGSSFTDQSFFTALNPGDYELTIQDANGCEQTFDIKILEPQEVAVELAVFIEGNTIVLGDSVEIQALTTIPEDSLDVIQWSPPEILSCDTCLNPIATPIAETTFSITIADNGCVDSDELTVFVRKERPIYVPNVFSPNGDGVNDEFLIYAGPQVVNIKSFFVFNRWGEAVHKRTNFLPNNPDDGWDGTYREELMNPAVFAWFAEIEFIDGSVEIFEGDVILAK